MSDKRSVSTDALETLGTLIGPDEKRDAIHLAVVPVYAPTTVHPGDHVNARGEPVQQGRADAVGIVDPFINLTTISRGHRFWLILYPRTITSLRHVWSHPAFMEEGATAAEAREAINSKVAESEAWLRAYVERSEFGDYDTALAIARGEPIPGCDRDYGGMGYLNDGEYVTMRGTDAYGDIDPLFWHHMEIVTGQKMQNRAQHFSCSC